MKYRVMFIAVMGLALLAGGCGGEQVTPDSQMRLGPTPTPVPLSFTYVPLPHMTTPPLETLPTGIDKPTPTPVPQKEATTTRPTATHPPAPAPTPVPQKEVTTTRPTATHPPAPAPTPVPPAAAAATGPAATSTASPAAGEKGEIETWTVAYVRGTAINVRRDAKLGLYLTDAKGKTLYRFTADKPNQSNCSGACPKQWPPFMPGERAPGVDPALEQSPGGTIRRDDGSIQLTYKGWPLYYFASDEAPGDAKGQGVGAVWYVVSSTVNNIASDVKDTQ